jgi:hypothetical protein
MSTGSGLEISFSTSTPPSTCTSRHKKRGEEPKDLENHISKDLVNKRIPYMTLLQKYDALYDPEIFSVTYLTPGVNFDALYDTLVHLENQRC